MMASELRKDVGFDVKLVSRLQNGIFHAEVCVQMKHHRSEQYWVWSKDKFLNRTYIMREIYDLFVQSGGGVPPELAQEEDPFWDVSWPICLRIVEPCASLWCTHSLRSNALRLVESQPPEPVLVGVANVYLSSLSYLPTLKPPPPY